MRNALTELLASNQSLNDKVKHGAVGSLTEFNKPTQQTLIFAYKRMLNKIKINHVHPDKNILVQQFLIEVINRVKDSIIEKDITTHDKKTFCIADGSNVEIEIISTPSEGMDNINIVLAEVSIVDIETSNVSFNELICTLIVTDTFKVKEVFPKHPLYVNGWVDELLKRGVVRQGNKRQKLFKQNPIEIYPVELFLSSLNIPKLTSFQITAISDYLPTVDKLVGIVESYQFGSKRRVIPHFGFTHSRAYLGICLICAEILKQDTIANKQFSKLLKGDIVLGGGSRG